MSTTELRALQQQTLPWVEKYRPSKLTDLVAHTEIIGIISKLIETNRLPHLLLYGPPGTGKTSTIIAAAKKMYGDEKYKAMTLELNASDDRGIDVVRNQIKEFAGTRQLFSQGVKLIILDEADAMTNDAQFALRRIIEKYTKNTRFCLICNYVSKIIPALQSRCTRFRFAPLQKSQIRNRLLEISDKEKCGTDESGIEAILDLANGDMRRVLNLLQAASMGNDGTSGKKLGEDEIYLTSGAPLPRDLKELFTVLWNKGFNEAVTFATDMSVLKGYALTDMVGGLGKLVLEMELPSEVLGEVMSGLSEVEHRSNFATREHLQIAAMVGVFVKARGMITPMGGGE
ncbi:hypothetical protein ScalyP_jg1925 [Parmales sp. scaly parma]|nr:hypothetical protein ScalyP_jg1925 [Parmales sp. scaly parma]